MKTTTSLFIIICLLLIPFLSSAKIKNGYWMGFTLTKVEESIARPSYQEWIFDNDSITVKKIDNYNEPTRSFIANWEIKGNDIILSRDIWSDDLSISFQFNNDMLTLAPEDDTKKIYLFYLGEKREFLYSNASTFLENRLFEINRPDLLYNSNEIEFWDNAFFYKKGIATCTHNYEIIEIGKYTFIFFNSLMPLRILSYDEQKIILEKIDDYEKIIFSKKDIEKEIDLKLFSGRWKWKGSDKKPSMNDYSISIGYQMHELEINGNGLIDWFSIHERIPHGIPRIIIIESPIIPEFISENDINTRFFDKGRPRKPEQLPSIKFSPSGKLIQFESYPIKKEESFTLNDDDEHSAGFREYYKSHIITLQCLHHTKDRIYLKYSNSSYYVTLIRVDE